MTTATRGETRLGTKAPRTGTEPKQTTPRIHPRIRERRVAVTKEAGLKRLKVALAAGLAVALTAAAWGLTRSPLLDVDEVRSVGAVQTSLADIIERGRLAYGTPMVDINPGVSAAAIQTLPWVATAKVERRWPGSVVVTVTERGPVAGVSRGDGSWALVDRKSRVLMVIQGPPPGVPHIHGAGDVPGPGELVPDKLADAVAAAAALPESLRRVVGGVNLRPAGVELALTAGGVVRLGDASRQLTEKLRAAATVLNRVGPEGIGVLDVTVPRAPVLARQ